MTMLEWMTKYRGVAPRCIQFLYFFSSLFLLIIALTIVNLLITVLPARLAGNSSHVLSVIVTIRSQAKNIPLHSPAHCSLSLILTR